MECCYWKPIWHPYLASWRFIRAEWYVQDCHETAKTVCPKKTEFGLDLKIEKMDIIRMVHHAWVVSFGNIENNKTATADREWNPLNYILLDHGDLKGSTGEQLATM